MNKIFSWRKLALIGILPLISSLSCTDSYTDYNTDKHTVTEEIMSYDNLKTGGFFAQMQRNVVIFKDGTNLSSDYQIAQGLSGDLYSGYLSPTLSSNNGKHNGSYYFITNWIQKTFASGFSDVMPAWQAIVEISKEESLPHIAALATVVKVEGMHRVADTYGPIPYVSYGSGSLKNDYDALDVVYKKFFDELDESIDVLTDFIIANPSSTVLKKYDLVYGGDATKWVKFANSLRLRLAMRIAYADPALAKIEAEKSINNVIGVMTNEGEKASLKHTSNLVYFHPLYEIAITFNKGDVRVGASMDAYMNGYNDPRLPAYFTPAVNGGGYHGVRLGIITDDWSKYFGDNVSNLNIDQGSTEIVWMNASESYFLRAEGALRGWNMGGTAKDFYEQGIRLSMLENGVGNKADTYIANSTSTPAAFVDHAENSSFNAPAPSSITIAWDESANTETKLERIITQKWISMYPNGPEGWAEYRRTGYPKLIPVVTNNSSGTVNTAIQVRRLPYPQSEYVNNISGVKVGVSKLSGLDNGGTKLWWDKK